MTNPMSQKRILITGAAGFLGSHLCDRFIKEGYYVIAMDNLITAFSKSIAYCKTVLIFSFIIQVFLIGLNHMAL